MSSPQLHKDVIELRQKITQAKDFIRTRTALTPRVGIVLGSGLGDLAGELQGAMSISYRNIPHFPVSTAPGHAGNLVLGKLCGKDVVIMQGRAHTYEGYPQRDIVFPIRVMHALGANVLIATCASGGLDHHQKAGDIMILSDHLNLTGSNPLVGPNDPEMGPRFPVMFNCYDPALRKTARQVALEQKLHVHEGVYAAIAGPAFMTAAELRHLMLIGANALGMSMVPEVIAATHMGMHNLGLAMISDMAIPDAGHHATEQDVLNTVKEGAKVFHTYLKGILTAMAV